MQLAKPWRDSMDNTKLNYAQGLLMGDVTEDELTNLFAPNVALAIIGMTKDPKLQAKVSTRMTKLAKQEANK